jgi:hydroxymethylglutaryl-CoA lyase
MDEDNLPEDVRIVEMLPRDGFQSLDEFVPTDTKVELIDRLSETGVDEIEFTSFTHPKAVPNLRDAEEVAERIDRRPDVSYRALVPNAVGMERALEADVDRVNALIAVSETYCEKNQNATREECIAEIERIVELANGTDVTVEAGMATSFYCPYEGRIPLEQTLTVVKAMVDAGVDEVTLATTMGLADPEQVSKSLWAVHDRWPDLDCGLHLHDTNGMSLANTLVAMQHGVDRFDTSVCGIGGGVVLPDELEGVGNTPTEDLLHMLSRMGITSETLFRSVSTVAKDVADQLSVGQNSHVVRGGTAEYVLNLMGQDN